MNPESEGIGLEALETALGAESFPTAKEGLFYAVGDFELEHEGQKVALRDVLDSVERDHFESAHEAVMAVRGALARTAPGRPEGNAGG